MTGKFVETFITLFFLLTPFFVVSTFLSLTDGMDIAGRRRLALRVILAVAIIAVTLFLFGEYIFRVLGITVDSFRIGAGALLFISAVSLVAGKRVYEGAGEHEDIAVVPLAMPVTVGPGTIGALMVFSADAPDVACKAVALAALLAAVTAIGVMLYVAAAAGRLLKPRIMSLLTRLTGLILAALSAQLIFTGIRNFMTH